MPCPHVFGYFLIRNFFFQIQIFPRPRIAYLNRIRLTTRVRWYPNRPRSIYQYSSMAPRLSGQNCKFFKLLLSLNSQKRLGYKENNTKYRILTRKPRSHVRILIYRTWPIHSRETRPTRCAAVLVYCSVGDWTRFSSVIGFENIRIHRPYITIRSGSFSSVESELKISRFADRVFKLITCTIK